MVKHGFVQANGVKLHYAEEGKGQVMLFLHGFPDGTKSFRFVKLRHSYLSLHHMKRNGLADSQPGSVRFRCCKNVLAVKSVPKLTEKRCVSRAAQM